MQEELLQLLAARRGHFVLESGHHGDLWLDKDVVIVDDVINAGSAVRGTVAALRHYGARPAAIGSLLVLGSATTGFFAAQNMPMESIAALPNNLWEPDACPLCAVQVPLETIAF